MLSNRSRPELTAYPSCSLCTFRWNVTSCSRYASVRSSCSIISSHPQAFLGSWHRRPDGTGRSVLSSARKYVPSLPVHLAHLSLVGALLDPGVRRYNASMENHLLDTKPCLTTLVYLRLAASAVSLRVTEHHNPIGHLSRARVTTFPPYSPRTSSGALTKH